MYAIVKTGGKQYKVAEGSTLVVEKLEGEPSATVELTEVLLVQSEGGIQVGAPTVAGAKVVATIVEQGKGKKINAITFKPKKNQRKRYGHRQPLTTLRVNSILTA
jgi:large subunit ribosomal protein L21